MDLTRQSVLCRARSGSPEGWRQLHDLYAPFIRNSLLRMGVAHHDAEDVTQSVLLSLLHQLAQFEHNGQRGAFRSWLRLIVVHRLADYRRANPPGDTNSHEVGEQLAQLEDPRSDLSRLWDQQYDAYLIATLLKALEPEFEPRTLDVFRRLCLEGETTAAVAAQFDMSPSAVYVAKSRVLHRLREVAEGLLD